MISPSYMFLSINSIIASVDVSICAYVIWVRQAKFFVLPALLPDSVDYKRQTNPLKHY